MNTDLTRRNNALARIKRTEAKIAAGRFVGPDEIAARNRAIRIVQGRA